MRIISLIQDPDVIRRILEHLGLWRQDTGGLDAKSQNLGMGQLSMKILMMAGLDTKNQP
jgi:hypothetical protein